MSMIKFNKDSIVINGDGLHAAIKGPRTKCAKCLAVCSDPIDWPDYNCPDVVMFASREEDEEEHPLKYIDLCEPCYVAMNEAERKEWYINWRQI